MDDRQFDRLTTDLARGLGRRRLLGVLGLGGVGAAVGLAGQEADARGKGKRHHHGTSERDHADGHDLAPAKKKKCKNGTVKCGKKCRNVGTDPANCGTCGHACASGESCTAGTCTGGCAGGQVKCGTACADTQIDSANCGSCGHACGSGESCQSGQCVAGCPSGQKLCGGTCVTSVGSNPCCDDSDCGGPHGSSFSNYIACDTTIHQCRCIDDGVSSKSTWGICQRYADGRGRCGECCLGSAGAQGSLNCQGEWGCNGQDFCYCPSGYSGCALGDRYHCYRTAVNADLTWDATHCPQSGSGTQTCYDCTEGGANPYTCCWDYTCVNASGYGPNTGGSLGTFCGGCTKCPNDKLCCNDGPGTAPSCKAQRNGGVCPPAHEQ